MSVTNKDRAFAIAAAEAITDADAEGFRQRGHISTELPLKETFRRGILTECAFANEFGLEVNGEVTRGGDGGRDFLLPLRCEGGAVRHFKTDVKTKSVRVSVDGLLRSGTHLRVRVRDALPLTIYVFGVYLETTDDAEVLRWQWGKRLIERNERRVFENGNDEECFVEPFESLRALNELKERIHQPPKPAFADKRCAVCGDTNANWSYDFGKCWYCGKHRQPI